MSINAYLLQRYNVLKVFLYTSLIICSIFSVINFNQGRITLGSIDVFIFFVDLIILLNFQKIIQSKYRETFVVSYSVLTLVGLLFLFWGGSAINFSYMWMVLIPFIGYLTNSFKNGFRLTAFFMVFSIGIYLKNTLMIDNKIDDYIKYVQICNIVILVLNIWALIHMYEKIRLNITDKLIELTTVDELTKLKTRSELYNIYRNYKEISMSLLLINIDALKDINVKYGNLAGDVVLMSIANIISDNKTEDAHAFRIDGDKFAILVPNTNGETYLPIAKKIFAEISDCRIVLKHDAISLKVSMSMSDVYSDGNNVDELIAKADELLKHAKESETDKIALA